MDIMLIALKISTRASKKCKTSVILPLAWPTKSGGIYVYRVKKAKNGTRGHNEEDGNKKLVEKLIHGCQ